MSKATFSAMDIKLVRSDILPARTMVVSPDLYDQLANNGEGANKAHAEFLAKAEKFSRLVKAAKS
ncbi:hypothetical protein [Pseudomonas syringae]|uniref:hypothetical protein n=1 Tax=Pseudomonas syringae TaxID=317 RepID=UPI001F43AC2A|nr:hypothetical protein [Pseudomonas syringae]MCF5227685.1 hypothetical protein [Pseudomonas syringae]MCF5244500.1 hypothetical protein [Pseudomonas syringae]